MLPQEQQKQIHHSCAKFQKEENEEACSKEAKLEAIKKIKSLQEACRLQKDITYPGTA